MELTALLVAILGNIFLGLFVYFKSPHNSTNQLLAVFAILIALWNGANYFSLHSNSPEATLFWIRVVMFFASALSASFLLFMHTFPGDKIRLRPRWLVPYLVLTIVVMGLSLSPLLFTDVVINNGNIEPQPGPAIVLFILQALGAILLGLFILVRKYLRANSTEKIQLRYLILGALTMFALILFSNVILVLAFKISALVVLSPLYTLVFVGATSYAIVKHRLLDIRLVVARVVAYTLLLVVFASVYVLTTLVSSSLFLDQTATSQQIIVYSILTLIVAFTFQPLRNLLEKITDKIFFKGKYDSSELLQNLTNLMATTFGLKRLTEKLLVRMLPEIKISKGAFILVKNGKVDFVKSTGFDKNTKFYSPDILSLMEEDRIIVAEEETKKGIKKILSNLDTTAAVPLKVKEGELGILLLGHKLSGEIYTNQDINLLQILAPEVSIAIQNAKLYEEQTERLEREVARKTADLRSANERLKELDKLKDEFMSIASHELRTPMTAIKSYVWLALHGKTHEKDPKVRDYLNRVFESSERMINMINDMLNVSRIETGRLKLDIIPVSIWKVAEQVKDDLSAKAAETGVDIVIKKDTLAPLVMVDKDKLAEIYTNLIGNSLKFTKKGGRVTVTAGKKGNMVEVSVSDTGVGISKENLGKLFKKYGKLNESYATASPSTGTGLGLYITKQYLEKMGGSINVTSELGKGTTFTFSLPIASGKDLQKHEKDEEKMEGVIINPKLVKQFEAERKAVKREVAKSLSKPEA